MDWRLPIVGVMGSGSREHASRARPVGELIATLGAHLLTGGGGGVMTSVSRAFAEHPGRSGAVIGVLPSEPGDDLARPRPGYPNPWVEIAITTHLPLSGESGREPLSRNHVNILTSRAVVVLPGGAGTASEALLAAHYRKPLLAFLDRDEMPRLPDSIATTTDLRALRRFLSSAIS